MSRAREIATDALLMETDALLMKTSAGSSAQNHEQTGKKLISFDLIFNWHWFYDDQYSQRSERN